MRRIYNAQKALAYISDLKSASKTIGFIPTMGGLHQGHYSLIEQSKNANDVTVSSIFVNPTQFNNTEDLDKYPRTIEADCKGLEEAGCDIVFLPTIDEIYPGGAAQFEVSLDLQGLDAKMEGPHRPGHFAGVVQVVKRLLDIVPATHLYMGQKDYQQFTIIRHMIRELAIKTKLVVCTIIRENDGLAMSSRNRRLTKEHRDDASILFRVLSQAKEWINHKSISEIETKALEYLNIPGFKPAYFEIVNGHTLETIDHINGVSEVVACTAVWAGDVRLIDNMRLIASDNIH